MPHILQLPSEILSNFLIYLSSRDLCSVSLVCKRFREAVQVDELWRQRCLEDCGIPKEKLANSFPYQVLYTKLLHRYGYLIGLWQTLCDVYGGLLQVKFDSNKLIGLQYYEKAMNLLQPWYPQSVFEITLTNDNKTQIRCLLPTCMEDCSSHDGEVDRLGDGQGFRYRCSSPGGHGTAQSRMERWFSEWLGTDLGDGDQMDDYYEHQLLIRRFKYTHIPELECKRLSWPAVTAHPVLRPGLFKASYGAHGTELILVSYKGLEMQGYKVSGDPNVPAGQISICADLTQSLILSEEQQSSVQLLTDIDLPDAAPAVATALEQLPPQPFFLPHDCSYREPRNDCPKKCKARFLGKLQIAGHGFKDPSLTPMHWIVFNEDLFGVLWLDLRNFFTFHRVETDFKWKSHS